MQYSYDLDHYTLPSEHAHMVVIIVVQYSYVVIVSGVQETRSGDNLALVGLVTIC